jgi:hypothetical protein
MVNSGNAMMNYLHSELNLEAGDVVVVKLDSQANVVLMNWSNYEAYQDGRAYRYYGGLAEKTPVRLEPPGAGTGTSSLTWAAMQAR